MSLRSLGSAALLAAGLFGAACQEGSTGSPVEPVIQADLGLEVALVEAGDAATAAGDTDRAEVLRHGVQAIRWGIRPSRIEVKIQNETYTYLALVIGTVRRGPDGGRVLIRSLVAWTGRPATALFHVVSKSDHGLFGGNGNGNDYGPEGARGQWKDLVQHQLWIATAGFADLELASTGDPCPVQPGNPQLACVLARFDVKVNGSFQQKGPDGPGGPAMAIHTDADGVRGVVIQPAGD